MSAAYTLDRGENRRAREHEVGNALSRKTGAQEAEIRSDLVTGLPKTVTVSDERSMLLWLSRSGDR